MKHHASALKRKLGPLPVWGWAIVTGTILYVVRNRSGKGGGLGGLLDGGASIGQPAGASAGAAGGGQGDNAGAKHRRRARNHKPPRKRKHKIPRPKRRPPHGHGHKQPRPGSPEWYAAHGGSRRPNPPHKPKRRPLVIPGRKHHRDRTTLTHDGAPQGVTRLLRGRGHFDKLNPSTVDTGTGNARDGQRSELHFPVEQGRSHTGGHDRAFRTRDRTATPAPEGRTDRRRGLAGQPAPHAIDRGHVAPAPQAAPAKRPPARTPNPHGATTTRRRER